MTKRPSRLFVLLAAGLPLAGPACSTTAERAVVEREESAAANLSQTGSPRRNDSATAESGVEGAAEISPVSYADLQELRPTIANGYDADGYDSNAFSGFDVVPTPAAPLPMDEQADRAGMTLAALEDLALRNNPAIQQAGAAAARAAGIRTQVGLKPNPSIGYFGSEIGIDGAAGQNGAFVQQTFVTGGKLAWSQTVVGHDVNALLWQVEAQRQRVRTDIQVQFYAALAAQRRLELAREFRHVAERGVQVSEDRLRIQVGARPDLLQSQMQLNEVDLLIQRTELDLEAAWNQLAATAGLSSMLRPELIGDLETPPDGRDTEAVYQQIVATSPLLASARARVDRARANLQLQQQQPIPNITAQLGAGHDDASGDEFANVQLSLPLPLHNKNQGNVRAAHAEYCEATQNVQRLMLQTRRDLAGVMREHEVARVTVEQYASSILPKASESLDLIQQAQDAGQIDFLRVLTARRMFFDANLEYVRALGELAQTQARLDGLLLTGGLENVPTYEAGDDLRGQSLNIQ
jgi:outer membrane protein, heavy metal efflux system